jgi:hypothetical protein
MKKGIFSSIVAASIVATTIAVCFSLNIYGASATLPGATSPKNDTGVVHSGKRSLKVMKTETVAWAKAFYSYLSLQQNKTYRISMWVKIPTAKNRMDIRFFANLAWVDPTYVNKLGGRAPWMIDGIGNIKYPTPALYPACNGTDIKDDAWHQIISYYTVAPAGDPAALNPSPGTSDTYGIQIWTDEKATNILTDPMYLDDFEAIEVNATTKDPVSGAQNLISNPGFEGKLSQMAINWSNFICVNYGFGTDYSKFTSYPYSQ